MNIINPGQLLPLLVATLINILKLESSLIGGNKKRRGSKVSLRAYPCSQALALPLDKDKQRKACPRRVIYINPIRPDNPRHIYTKTHSTWGELHLIYIYKGNRTWENIKIHPRERLSSCITAVSRFKFARFGLHRQVTFENVLSRLAVQLAWGLFQHVKFNHPPTLRQAFRCKFTYIFLITKYFLGKNHILTKKSWFIDKNSD